MFSPSPSFINDTADCFDGIEREDTLERIDLIARNFIGRAKRLGRAAMGEVKTAALRTELPVCFRKTARDVASNTKRVRCTAENPAAHAQIPCPNVVCQSGTNRFWIFIRAGRV